MNTEQHKVSIIIPIYNAEKTLVKCLESVVNQTYKNIEIILINDGSSDKSEAICKDYLEKDTRIIYIKQENKGIGFTRNKGISLSTSDYICFVDSDDWVEDNYVELLINNLVKYDADISIGEVNYVFTVEDYLKKPKQLNEKIELLKSEEALKLIFLDKELKSFPWMKIFKKSLFKNIKYPENITHFEDLATNYKIFSVANKIVRSNQKIYNYVYFQNSNSNSKEILRQYEFIITKNEMFLFSKNYKFDSKTEKKILKNTLSDCFYSIKKIIRQININFLPKELETVKKELRHYLNNDITKLNLEHFVFLRLFIYFPHLFYKLIKLNKKKY